MKDRALPKMGIWFVEGDRVKIDSLKGRGVTMHTHHYHNFYEVYYMVEGKGTYFINDQTYDIVSGDIIFVPPNIIHSTDYGDKEHERILLEFSEHMIPKFLKDRFHDIPNLYRHPGVAREVYLILREIEREYKNPDDFSTHEISCLISHLLTILIRNLSAVKVVHSRDAVISEVVAFIKENYQSDITLKQLANMHFISPEHLSRTFKKETNFGFNEFISLVRLQKAEQLLREREKRSISEIAYSCGFNDSNYFSDKFKRTYGISPLQYSKSLGVVKASRTKNFEKEKPRESEKKKNEGQ